MSAAGSPSTRRRPWWTSPTRWHRSASSMYGVETSTVIPPCTNSWRSAHSSRRETGSTPFVGSSRSSTSGSCRSAHASASFLYMPPESASARRSRNGASRVMREEPLGALAVDRAREHVEPREEPEVLVHREVAVQAVLLRHEAEPLADARPTTGPARARAPRRRRARRARRARGSRWSSPRRPGRRARRARLSPTSNESPSSAVTAPKRRTSASASSAGPDAVARSADTRYLPVPVSVTCDRHPGAQLPVAVLRRSPPPGRRAGRGRCGSGCSAA